MEQLLTIELFGRPYTFKADEGLDRAKEVADLIVREVERVEMGPAASSTEMSKMAVLLLVTLNIANENYELKREQASLYQTVTTRSENLLNLLGDQVTVLE